MTQREDDAERFVVAVRVKPGASHPRVGGAHGSALVVAVTARAIEGRATRAVLEAVAEAFGVRPSHATLLAGRTSRDKLIALSPPPADAASRLAALRGE